MLKNGQLYVSKCLRFLNYDWPFFNVMHDKVKGRCYANIETHQLICEKAGAAIRRCSSK